MDGVLAAWYIWESIWGFPYALIFGKVVHLEVEDDIYDKESGSWDIEKAKPLMMIGSDSGMHFCTVNDTGKFEPYGAMFKNGKDPLERMYKKGRVENASN